MPSYPDAPGFYPDGPRSYPGYTDDVAAPVAPPVREPSAPMLTTGQPSSAWLIGIGPAKGGGIVRELPQASSPRLTWKLGDSSETSVEIDGRSTAAALISELSTDLHVQWRPDPFTPRRQLYRGRVGKASDKITRTEHRVTVPSVDYRGLLKRRHLMTGSTLTYTGVDQGLIGWGLIDGVQHATGGGGDMGITLAAPGTTGVTRTRTFALEDEVAATITELSEVDGGFEWDIVAPDERRLLYTVFSPRRGTDRGVVIELGGAAMEVTRDVDSSAYGNALRVKGQAPEGGSQPPPYETYAADIATRPEGRWDLIVSTGLTSGTAIGERLPWQLAQSQAVPVSYSFAMRPGWWQGPDHVWLGDTVRAVVYSGRLRVDTSLRVQQMDVTPGRDGGEAVSISVGAPPPDPRRRAGDIETRLAALERR